MDNSQQMEFAIYTKRKRAARDKIKWVLLGGISLFQMLPRARLAYPKLICDKLAFEFTL